MDKSRKLTAVIGEGRKFIVPVYCMRELKVVARYLSLVLTCLLIWGSREACFAQSDDEPVGYFIENQHTFYTGVVGGVNLAQVDGDNFAGYYKAALNIGGIGYMKVARRVSLSWEILYSQKGSKSDQVKYSGIDSVLITNYTIDLKYAEIPVMINVFDKMKSHLCMGFSYNRLISATENLQTYPNYPVDLTKYPFKKVDWEFLAGAQLHLFKGLFFNLRFQYSIVPMRTDTPPNFSRAPQYNNLWTVRLMYLFM